MYNKNMELIDLKNKKIMLFGKSRSFSLDELEMQLRAHGITLAKEYDQDVDYVVDGAMMSPIETLKSDEIYEKKDAEFLKVEQLEKLLSTALDEDVLMMSLKLSSDKQRLINFLKNQNITDDFFFKLLDMYDWGDDDFYENDNNRDVTASIIVRFYKNIETNHNIEFSKLGLMHLVLQTKDPKLLQTIASLKPLRKSFKQTEDDHGFKIVTSIATNFYTPKSVLKMLIKEANTYVKKLISMRDFLDQELQQQLYNLEEKEIIDSLAYCKNLSDELYKRLRDDDGYTNIMAKHIKLDQEKYEFFQTRFPLSLAQNETINSDLQEQLAKNSLEDVKLKLASNKGISSDLIYELLKKGNKEINYAIYSNPSIPKSILVDGFEDLSNHYALAQNQSTPSNLLEKIYKDGSYETNVALARNVSTPVDILYQLQLDARYEKFVKENKSFSDHIKQENIGWL